MAVTPASGRPFEQLVQLHPALGEHLECRVRTGFTCGYAPVRGGRRFSLGRARGARVSCGLQPAGRPISSGSVQMTVNDEPRMLPDGTIVARRGAAAWTTT